MATDVKKSVWIDCDPGVDDAVALILADYLYGDEIAGVSAVAGNSPIENTWPNAHRLKKLIGGTWPLYKGAAAQIPLSIVSLITDSMR